MLFTKSLATMAVAAAFVCASPVYAETINAVGKTEISIKANGELVNARRLARESAERDAVMSALKLRMNIDTTSPATQTALGDLAKQLTDNLKTSFLTEGDILTAKTVLSVDSAELFDLARSVKGLVSTTATASAKILFLIDEYYGIATNIQPGQPLETEISYSHDKSKASASKSASSSANSSKESVAVSGKEKSAVAASDSSSVAARDRAAVSGRDRAGVAVSDASGSGAASRDTNVAASRDTSVSGSRKAAVAASAESSFAGASKKENASASAQTSSSASAEKDVVNYSFKQKFPDTNNAKPADDAAALISQRLEQIIKPYGLTYTPERDFRRDSAGAKLLISDIEKQSKFEALTEKAAKQPYSAKYIVYGSAVMSIEGKTASGDTTCSGLLKITSFSVDSGDGLISGTLGKRAQGTSDQDCRTQLATALATELASTVGNTAAKELQLAATQGQSFYVMLYSTQRVAPSVRRSFTKKLESMAEKYEEDNVTDNSRSFVVQAKTGFRSKLEEFVEDLAEENKESMKNFKMVAKGNRMVICLEGACPKDF
jgi:hypothetical protein